MKKQFLLALMLNALLFTATVVHAADLKRGQYLFQACTACHGLRAEGNQVYGAPQLSGSKAWYVSSQLKKFQQGIRGAHHEDVSGLKMRPMSRYLRSDEDVENVAVYIATLLPRVPPKTLEGGNIANGKIAYGTCAACHGMDAKGMDVLKAPGLSHLNDWYIMAQIRNYKTKIRGTSSKDVEGLQMAPMAMTLADDQMIKDVIAYIESLR